MRKKNIALLGAVSLGLMALVGGTWAAWTQELTAGNEFRTANYSTKLEEKFQSPDDWQPGVETEKNVWLSNPGEVPVLTKAVVSQSWVRREDVLAVTEPGGSPSPVKPLKGESYPLTLGGDDGYAALIGFNTSAVSVLRQGLQGDGVSLLGLPIADSFEDAAGGWLLLDETPDENGSWTFYYVGVVEPKGRTPHLIESVTMNPKAGNTVLGKKTEYIKHEDTYEQVTIDLVNPEPGYDSATYTLTVSMTTVQATRDAVIDVFAGGGRARSEATEQILVQYLADNIAGTGIFTSDRTGKSLRFNESGGTMEYTVKGAGSGTEDGSWFMSFTDMVPGGTYIDEMTIENHSRKNFDVFMQVVPRNQDTVLKDDLLKLITMKVYYNDQKIYDGTAMGAIDPESNNMQEERPLGYYAAGSSGKIRVELQLSKDLTLDGETVYYNDGSGVPVELSGTTSEYMGILTKIDWKFMVQERSDGRRPGGGGGGGGSTTTITPDPVPTTTLTTIDGEEVPLALIPDEDVPLMGMLPQTGDEQPILLAAALLVLSGTMMIFLVVIRRRRRRES